MNVGDYVCWQWLGRKICGEVVAVYKEPITVEIKGKNIKRNGSPERPAYLVRSVAGNLALKLATELKNATSDDVARIANLEWDE